MLLTCDCPAPKPEPCKMSGPESWVPVVCASSCLFTMQPVWQFGQIASSAQASAQTCSNNAIPGTPNDPNPIQNQAIRHCVASAILRCKLGRQCARCAANERENWQRMCADQTCSATLRGIDNNNNGIDLGIKCGSECEDCTQAMREGKLSLAPEVLDDQNPDPRCKELPPRGTIGNPGGPVKPII
jgi:hypothetical protein